MAAPTDAPGLLLRSHRERRGWSIRQAAKAAGVNNQFWGAVERGHQAGRDHVRPSRAKLIEMAIGLDLAPSERDELLATFGYEPVGLDAARRKLEEAAELLGMTAAQRDRLLTFAGVAQSEPSGHDAAASDPALGLPTAGEALHKLSAEDREAIVREVLAHTTGQHEAAPGPTQGGVDGAGKAAHDAPAGRRRRAAGGDE